MNVHQVTELVAQLVEADIEDLEEGEFHGQVHRFTPSVVTTRHFLALVDESGRQFLITVEEA